MKLKTLAWIGFIISSLFLISVLITTFMFTKVLNIWDALIALGFMLTCIWEIKKD